MARSRPIGRCGKYPYDKIGDAQEKARELYVLEMLPPREVYKALRKLVKVPFTEDSLSTLLTRWGLSAQRREVKKALPQFRKGARKLAMKKARSEALSDPRLKEKVATETADTVLARSRQGAEKHFNRMEALHDRAHEQLEKVKVGPKTVGIFLSNMEKFDQLGRRMYGMDKQQEMNKHQLNLNILVNGQIDHGEVVPIEANVQSVD